MHFNRFFSTKAYLRCVLRCKIIRLPFFPYQSLLLSTIVLNDIKLNKEWARSVLRRMGFTKRRANSKSKILPNNFEEIKEQFLTDVQSVIDMEEVPPSLILNWEHTAMKIVPFTQWTMEKKGQRGWR